VFFFFFCDCFFIIYPTFFFKIITIKFSNFYRLMLKIYLLFILAFFENVLQVIDLTTLIQFFDRKNKEDERRLSHKQTNLAIYN